MAKYLTDADQSDLTVVLPALRREVRLSQGELADLAGLARSAISAIERGTTRPKVETLRLIADGLATDGRGDKDLARAEQFYRRLMQAAGYMPSQQTESTEIRRPVEDLTNEEVVAALTLISKDPRFSADFMSVAEDWEDMDPEAQRFVLNGFESARKYDQAIKASRRNDAPPRHRRS